MSAGVAAFAAMRRLIAMHIMSTTCLDQLVTKKEATQTSLSLVCMFVCLFPLLSV